jgi:hypothetical protein
MRPEPRRNDRERERERERVREVRFPTAPIPHPRLTDYTVPSTYQQEYGSSYGQGYHDSETYYSTVGRGATTAERPYADQEYISSTRPRPSRDEDPTPHYIVAPAPPQDPYRSRPPARLGPAYSVSMPVHTETIGATSGYGPFAEGPIPRTAADYVDLGYDPTPSVGQPEHPGISSHPYDPHEGPQLGPNPPPRPVIRPGRSPKDEDEDEEDEPSHRERSSSNSLKPKMRSSGGKRKP